MSGQSSWAEVRQRMRAGAPEANDAEREARRQAARTATEAYVLGHHLRVIRCSCAPPFIATGFDTGCR